MACCNAVEGVHWRVECCICHGMIEDHNGWQEGHSAGPIVKHGRCCDNCYDTVVEPARVKESS